MVYTNYIGPMGNTIHTCHVVHMYSIVGYILIYYKVHAYQVSMYKFVNTCCINNIVAI